MTKEEYIDKINRRKKEITDSIIANIKRLIEMRDENDRIVESCRMSAYEGDYFNKEALDELEKEYPFLKFRKYNNIISWRLK